MALRTYKVSDLKQIVKESAISDFEPKFGKNVQSDNKKINDKAYTEMEKATSDYDGGMTKEKTFTLPYDDNKGMESLEIENANKSYTDRVKSQLKGYPSKQAEDIHKNEKLGNAQYGGDDVVKQFKDKAQRSIDGRVKATEIGLTGRELNHKDVEDQHKSMFGEGKKIKKLTFKNTVFLSENHMLSRIPDYYMTEGNRFIMRDKNSNEYLIEWHNDKPSVTRKFTQENILSEQNRMKFLSNYNSGDKYKTSTVSSRINENKEISDMLGKVRKLMK